MDLILNQNSLPFSFSSVSISLSRRVQRVRVGHTERGPEWGGSSPRLLDGHPLCDWRHSHLISHGGKT